MRAPPALIRQIRGGNLPSPQYKTGVLFQSMKFEFQISPYTLTHGQISKTVEVFVDSVSNMSYISNDYFNCDLYSHKLVALAR